MTSDDLIDSGSSEAEARDRLAEIGFAEVERRMNKMKVALNEIGSVVVVAVPYDGSPFVHLMEVWRLQEVARKGIE